MEDRANDTAMHDPSDPPSHPQTTQKPPYSRGHTLKTLTISRPQFAYIHLSLTTSSLLKSTTPLDNKTIWSHLHSALTQFLGLTGSAIPIDILRIRSRDVWLRVPRQDRSPVLAAVGGWSGDEEGVVVGWTVRGAGNWLSGLVARDGEERVWDG
ncbi:hypothetical protein HYFRA_00009937 [Hymenoscyphus fraxineus]|uniref:Ribonucleases P/MRP subunit Pop8-like domain-containing protein n=1 Tax=Hymenoscyphus fraxineus TaxID=746836 RepID=A0A9N9L6H2_9HELO|nr:hypothetical protein HYFRA_00009937 [Hymenoscyphus fraxineus]